MGSGSSRMVIWALCFLLLLPEAGSAKPLWKRALHTKLGDKSRAEDNPWQSRADLCPPPPQTLPPDACQALRCQADTQCSLLKRCCYNGCTYTCLEAVPPPPAEACSTTEDGAEPLRCPSGYECHILSPGDMAEGIPNHGQCVRQRQLADGRFLRPKFSKEYPEGDSKNVAGHRKGHRGTFRKATTGWYVGVEDLQKHLSSFLLGLGTVGKM